MPGWACPPEGPGGSSLCEFKCDKSTCETCNVDEKLCTKCKRDDMYFSNHKCVFDGLSCSEGLFLDKTAGKCQETCGLNANGIIMFKDLATKTCVQRCSNGFAQDLESLACIESCPKDYYQSTV